MNILTSLDNRIPGVQSPSKPPKPINRPSRAEAEQAVITLIRWAGDDPDRERLIETPAGVVRAYEEAACRFRHADGTKADKASGSHRKNATPIHDLIPWLRQNLLAGRLHAAHQAELRRDHMIATCEGYLAR